MFKTPYFLLAKLTLFSYACYEFLYDEYYSIFKDFQMYMKVYTIEILSEAYKI